MSKCQIAVLPAGKLSEILASPDKQKELKEAKERSESILMALREARRLEPSQVKEPFNL